MSYSLGQAVLTRAQADRDLGWTKKKLRRYWNARAQACRGFADEGECLAQVARHVPVTISGLGQTGLGINVGTALTSVADIIRDPEAALRARGPAIVAAADKHVVGPLLKRVGQAAAPYMVKYVLPPLAILYVLTGISAYYSYQAAKSRRSVASNPRRKRRRRRRTSRR